MAKSSWGARPTAKRVAEVPSLDKFVKGSAETVRLNVLIPTELHRRVKSACAVEGVSMTEVVIEFLESRFPKK